MTMERKPEQYRLSPAMKMADLLSLRFSLPGVSIQLGIPFGFGDATVEEVCRRKGIDPDTFLLICSVYAFDDPAPARARLAKADLKDILRFLRQSHIYYSEVALKELSAALKTLIAPCGEKERRILLKFFNDYKDELEKHFDYEEKTVFPYAEAVLTAGALRSSAIDDYEENHSHVQEKLEDLKNLVMKYMPAVCGQQDVYRALFYIYSLEEDLRKHMVVEDDILVPLVNRKVRAAREGRTETPRSEEAEDLSAREKEILVCVARGMLNKEIADAENISIHTVITHRKNITRKTGIKTVAGLTVYALLNNLIDINTIE